MHVEQPLVVVHPHLFSIGDETGIFWLVFSPFGVNLNSARSVDSMGVLVPRECVRVERSEDVTHPEKIHFEGQICGYVCEFHTKNVRIP